MAIFFIMEITIWMVNRAESIKVLIDVASISGRSKNMEKDFCILSQVSVLNDHSPAVVCVE